MAVFLCPTDSLEKSPEGVKELVLDEPDFLIINEEYHCSARKLFEPMLSSVLLEEDKPGSDPGL